MRIRARVVLLILLVNAAATAVASTDVENPAVIVVVKDDRDATRCTEVQGVCAFWASLNTTDPGNSRADVYQRIRYVGAAPNSTSTPTETARLDGNSSLPNPVFPTVTTAWRTYGGYWPVPEVAGLNLTEENAAFYYNGQNVFNPIGTTSHNEYGLLYDEGHGGVAYDHVGLANNLEGSNSDYWVTTLDAPICLLAEFECTAYDGVSEVYENATPNVVFGFEWYSVQVTTNRNALNESNASSASPLSLNRTQIGNETDDQPAGSSNHRTGSDDARDDAGPRPSSWRGPVSSGPGSHTLSVPSSSVPPPARGTVPLLLLTTVGLAVAYIIGTLFSRFNDKRSVLASKRRQAVIQAVRAHPGIRMDELARATGLARSSARHHVAQLERLGILRTVRSANYRAVFIDSDADECPAFDVERSPARSAILDALGRAPGALTSRELAALIPHVPERTRNHALADLVRLGFILRDGKRGRSSFKLAAALDRVTS